jgi:hypothetical protein
MTKDILGYNGNVCFLNSNNESYMLNNFHYIKYEKEEIKFVWDMSVESFNGFSTDNNSFTDHHGYGGGKKHYYINPKELTLEDLNKFCFLHDKTVENLLNGEMCVTRESFVHIAHFGATVENAKHENKEIYFSGKIYRIVNNCPYKSIKVGNRTLIVVGKTNNGNNKIILK